MLPLIFRCKHLVVLGDPEQLPAIGAIGRGMENALAERFGVEAWMSQFGHNDNDAYQTALKTLPALSDRAVHLTDHYRSHPLIIGFSNINIYHKSLRLLRHRHEGGAMDASGVFAVGVSGVAERGPNNASWINKPEAEAVVETVRGLRGQGGRTDTLIGVVTPFKAQTDHIRLLLEQENLAAQVLVNTVYAFQGDERDIMIFSPVVAMGMSEGAVRWVEQPSNLINVAVTRARDAFYLVADIQMCQLRPGLLGKLSSYVQKVERIRKSSYAELEFYSLMVMHGYDPEHHRGVADMEVDFVLEANGVKLAIEIDGATHDFKPAADAAIGAALAAHHYTVERFSARDVFEKPTEVVDRIKYALG